jgi:hypothetical protein
MDLASTCIRHGGRGMTVQAEGHGAHRMLGSARNTMLVVIKVTAMTTLTVFTADCAYRTTGQGAICSGIVTGSTAVTAMDICATNERGTGSGIMTVETEANGQSRMAVAMVVKISRMTIGTDAATVIGKSGAIGVVHCGRYITIR